MLKCSLSKDVFPQKLCEVNISYITKYMEYGFLYNINKITFDLKKINSDDPIWIKSDSIKTEK